MIILDLETVFQQTEILKDQEALGFSNILEDRHRHLSLLFHQPPGCHLSRCVNVVLLKAKVEVGRGGATIGEN